MKEKKKFDKIKTKEIIKKVLHVVGYVSIGAWVLFGLLVGCSYANQGVRSQDKQETRELTKRNAPINNVVYDYIYDINDIEGVYVDNLLYTDFSFYFTRYKAYSPFELYSVGNGSFLISSNITSYTFINTMFNNLNYPYGNDTSLIEYDLDFNLLQTTDNGTANNLVKYYPVYNNFRFDSFKLVPVVDLGVVSSAQLIVGYTNLTDNSQGSITYYFHNTSSGTLCHCSFKLYFDILEWLFNGDLFYAKILPNNNAYKYYERFIYLFNSKSVNNIYAHTQFDYDSLSWLGLYVQNTKWTSIYGGYAFSLYNVINANDMIIDLLYGDFRLNGAYYHLLRLVYGLVPSDYSGLRLQDAYGNIDDFVLRSNNLYIRYLKYIDLYNPINGRTEHLCDFKFDTQSIIDNSGSTTIDEDWIVYSKDFSPANNREFLISSLIPYNSINLDSQQINYDYFDTSALQNTNYSLFDGALNYLSITHESINYHDYSNFIDTDGVTWIRNSFTLISLGFEGLWGFLGIYILPGITIGTLILTPLLITLFLILLKIFKAH